jgi:hypothetical protein
MITDHTWTRFVRSWRSTSYAIWLVVCVRHEPDVARRICKEMGI